MGTALSLRQVQNRRGFSMPVLGQGTWRMGENARRRKDEVDALRLGLDLGSSLIDTAEMYGDGGAERVVGEAIAGRRDGLFLVSKVLPQNASRQGTVRAAERSLERLGTDHIDLYLLHWPGSHPLEETYAAFRQLVEEGKILHYGVSNFDTAEMDGSERVEGGQEVAADQVLYNVQRRAAENSLLPWCQRHGVTLMAYSPYEQGRLRRHAVLEEVARRRGATTHQIALAWTLREPGVVAVPKATRPEHVRENVAAAGLELTPEELAEIDRAFPRPPGDAPLEFL